MNIPMTVIASAETIQIGVGSDSVSLPVSVMTNHQIPVNVSANSQLVGVSAGDNGVQLPVDCVSSITVADFPSYDGPFSFTPSTEAQVIHVRNKAAYQDITIDPIPSNYGQISWNGSVLTVS